MGVREFLTTFAAANENERRKTKDEKRKRKTKDEKRKTKDENEN